MSATLLIASLLYTWWSPGRVVTDGRHDRWRNGIWLQHGWLGDDEWFIRQGRQSEIAGFRDPERLTELAQLMRQRHITDLFPHVAPAQSTGELPPVDDAQVRRLLNATAGLRVMPWVGGVLDQHCLPESKDWREGFIENVCRLLDKYPEFAGIHLNIEPWPTGYSGCLTLLEELRTNLRPGAVLSIAAYPPPTIWHRHPQVHWDRDYFQQVAGRADQLAVMMYDTSLRSPKFYRSLMAGWTREVLEWSGDTSVLLGLPTYDDAGVGYHHPQAENLVHALAGIHEGLAAGGTPPPNYQGVALYSEWETDGREWEFFRQQFLAPSEAPVDSARLP